MTPRYPTLALLGLAGACALLSPIAGYSDATPTPAVEPSPAAKALDVLEAQAPKEWKDPLAIAASHGRVIALIEGNTLATGEDYRRAAMMLQFHLGEYRIVRLQYELMLTATAKGDEVAERALAMAWDQLMGQIGRPRRFDFGGWAQKNPDYAEYEAAPACIQAVWRDPAAARARLAGVVDNAELIAIRDADQADRQGNWSNRTDEERQATMARDKARNARTREIVAAGDLHTANDFARAALVLQHSARFDGFRLAHELAVASTLLGDRKSGRWLAAASYDRILRSVGLDQRFGTQMGPDGPIRVDESGICDNQRVALGCPTLAQARTRRAGGSQVVDKLTQEIVRPGNVIHDAKLGVQAVHPAGWSLAQATQVDERTRSIRFKPAGSEAASFVFYYRQLDAPQPTARNEAEALLRQQAQAKEADRRQNAASYTNRPGGLVYAPANGQPAVRWFADYNQDGAKWAEYLVRILGPNSVGLLFLNAPADQIEALKPAVDAMAETVQLP